MLKHLRTALATSTVAALLVALLVPLNAKADALWTLEGPSSFSGTVGVAMPVTGLQVSGTTTLSVPVKLVTTSGTLAMSTTAGLTFSGASTGSTVSFSGSYADVNAALATLTYTRGSTGSDTLEVSLVSSGEVFFADNGHLYKYIADAGTWTAAKIKAEQQSAYGASGYLTTITSQAENDFVAARLQNAGWMGASDSATEGDWKWVSGPETGTSFWSGVANGSTVGGRYANWGTGEPNQSGEEDCGQFLSGGSGKWNDLPCTSTTLPGYVVEFGASGALPTVVAKNISITTTSAPSVSTLSPADNATGIATTANLVLQFSKTVSTSTGSIAIRRVSDNALVESFDVATSTAISGGGTNTVTINPVSNLDESTGYYVIVPGTAFVDSTSNFFAGITASTTWNFTTGDFTAPVISSLAASSTSSTTAAVSWMTNEAASTRLWYGFSAASGSTTALADMSPRVLSHEVTLASLVPCSTYSYRAVSADGSSNAATSSEGSFKTLGCAGNADAVSATSTPVIASAGGTTTLAEGGTAITVAAPSNFTSTSSSVVIQIQSLPGDAVLGDIGKPAGKSNVGGGVVFDVKAIIDSATTLDSFDVPVTITYNYTDAEIAGLDESSLVLYHYHNSRWVVLDNCSTDMAGNVISCTAPGFSIFALFGNQASGFSSVGSRSAYSGGTVFGCKDPKASNYNAFVHHEASRCLYASAAGVGMTASSASPVQGAGIPAGTVAFSRNLQLRMTGDDVKALQQYLNSLGFGVAVSGPGSPGFETRFFGAATRAALVRLQKANGIAPAIGFFGPLTRAFVTR